MSSKRGKQQTYGRIERTDIIINEPDRYDGPESSVRYGAGRGGFSLCDPAVTPARGQLFAVPPRPV